MDSYDQITFGAVHLKVCQEAALDCLCRVRSPADKALALGNEKQSINDAPSTLREKVIYFIFFTTSCTIPDYSLAPENYLEFVKFCEDLSNSLFYQVENRRQGITNLKKLRGLIQKLIK